MMVPVLLVQLNRLAKFSLAAESGTQSNIHRSVWNFTEVDIL